MGESVSGQAFRTEERLFCCPLIWCYSPGGDAFSISKTRFLPLCRWQGPLTHTATHTGKRADGSNGRKRAGKDDTPDQKGHKRPGKQKTSSSQSVGEDEVGGSNPPSSSRKRPLFTRKAVFSFDICNNFWEFKFPLLSLTTQQATDREKTGLQGHFAFGGPFVQYVSIAWSTCYIFRLHPVFPGGDLRLHLPN